MFQPLSLFIGLRYSRANKGNSFISFISFFSIAGIALGVLSLIVVVSVMNGFEAQLKDKILGVIPQIIVTNKDRQLDDWHSLLPPMNEHPEVVEIQPFIQTEAIIQSSSAIEGVMMQGVFADRYAPIKHAVVSGRWDSLYEQRFSLVIGYYLANKLRVTLGDTVRVMVAGASDYGPLGRTPRQRRFTVVGIFDTGSEIDDKVVFTNGSDGAKMLRFSPDQISGIRLYLHDAFSAPYVSEQLTEQLKDFLSADKALAPRTDELSVIDWRENYGKLFAAVHMEKKMMWIMLALIIAVAAFNIVSALVMMVTEKQGEIAILKTLGLQNITVQKIFIIQGLYNGLWGAVVGAVLGIGITLVANPLLNFFNLSLVGAGYGGLPILLKYDEVFYICFGALCLSFLATLYPAYKAANIKPVEVLRYE